MANMMKDIVGEIAPGIAQAAGRVSDKVKKDWLDAVAEEERARAAGFHIVVNDSIDRVVDHIAAILAKYG